MLLIVNIMNVISCLVIGLPVSKVGKSFWQEGLFKLLKALLDTFNCLFFLVVHPPNHHIH